MLHLNDFAPFVVVAVVVVVHTELLLSLRLLLCKSHAKSLLHTRPR